MTSSLLAKILLLFCLFHLSMQAALEGEAEEEVKDDQDVIAGAPFPCPRGFTLIRGARGCYRILQKSMTWIDAQKSCTEVYERTQLLAIRSRDEDVALADHIRSMDLAGSECAEKHFWTSGQRFDPMNCQSDFVWKPRVGLSESLGYTNWAMGKPDCFGGPTSCIEFTPRFDFKWNDVPCTWQACPICEYRL